MVLFTGKDLNWMKVDSENVVKICEEKMRWQQLTLEWEWERERVKARLQSHWHNPNTKPTTSTCTHTEKWIIRFFLLLFFSFLSSIFQMQLHSTTTNCEIVWFQWKVTESVCICGEMVVICKCTFTFTYRHRQNKLVMPSTTNIFVVCSHLASPRPNNMKQQKPCSYGNDNILFYFFWQTKRQTYKHTHTNTIYRLHT